MQDVMNLVVKVRLYPTVDQIKQFKAVTEAFRNLLNDVSQWYFDNHFEVDRRKFQKDMYYAMRSKYPQLNSLMIQSAFRCVNARYKSVATQLHKQPYHYQDINTNKWYTQSKDLEWLQKPIFFSRPQADYVRRLNYSFVKNHQMISMNGLGKRIKVTYNTAALKDLLNDETRLGTAKLVCVKKHWFLHIPVKTTYTKWCKDDNYQIVGIDCGLRQIMTIYDNYGKTQFFNGRKIAYIRRKYHYLRQQLQKCGTKSAKRHLKRLNHRENRYINDVNHQLTKTLVDHYGKNTLFVLEDLSNVTFEKKRTTKQQTRDLHSWSFYDLQQKLTYKALLNQCNVITVDAAYTSQRCPKYAQITKEARDHHLHLYQCPYCGYCTNDDRIGAMNLYELGKQYLLGDNDPHFEKLNAHD